MTRDEAIALCLWYEKAMREQAQAYERQRRRMGEMIERLLRQCAKGEDRT